MDQSQYLVAALRDMQAQPAVTQQQPDLAAMQKQAQARQAWEAANPGQSYMQHSVQQMGQSLQQAPQRAMDGIMALGRQQTPPARP